MDSKDNKEMEGPESYYCPISGELMKDPVIDPEGNTYDRRSIEAWLVKNATSPVTRSPLTQAQLAPNRALKEAIEQWQQQMQQQGKQVASKVVPKPLLAGDVKCQVIACGERDKCHDVVVTVDAGQGKERVPVDIVCVIDISGSMDTEAKAQDEQGVSESHGLSLLDIVKHAVSTIIFSLGPDDRVALVSYSDSARVELKLTSMTKDGQKTASDKLNSLHTEGSTNLWDGLLKGMDVLRNSERGGRQGSVFLLTDGQPNVAPPRGHLQMLQRYKEDNNVNFNINTFGFGYNLTPLLLDELATEGGGAYAFIPEATFVGTCFVNAMSNMLVTAGMDASISVEQLNGARVVEVLGGHQTTPASWGAKVGIGSLQYGQPKQLVVRMDISHVPEGKPYCNTTVRYVTRTGDAAQVEVQGVERSPSTAFSLEHVARSFACTAIQKVVAKMNPQGARLSEGQAIVHEVIKAIRSLGPLALDSKNVVELLKDVEGQVTEATSKDEWYKRWGRHYLPSLCRAHQLQQCNNFKDPGVQVYGGKLFQKQRDVADNVFLALPPPKPSLNTSGPAVTSMNAYYNSAAVCFTGDSLLDMADGSSRPCRLIRAGDVLRGGRRVRCVVETKCPGGQQRLVRLADGVVATPWHPIEWEGRWTFPCHVGRTELLACESTWNFVLEDADEDIDMEKHEWHVVWVAGVKAATLGHGLVEHDNDVRAHLYWGQQVVDDLAQMPGWKAGHVCIQKPAVKRLNDNVTGHVCALIDLSI